MSTEDRYNGWANRETWAVALHINNDQGWQESVRELVRNAVDGFKQDPPVWTVCDDEAEEQHLAAAAGEAIRDEVEDVFDTETYGLSDSPEDCQNFVRVLLPILADIGSLWRVDWTELGAALLEDLED